MAAASEPNRELLVAALRGNVAAADAMAHALADMVWAACCRVTRGEADAEMAFQEVMAALRANGFARLKGYDGRASVKVYAALAVRDLLSERAIKLLVVDGGRGWRAFEAFFGADIRRMLTRVLPGTNHQQNREDGYQSVCEALLKDDFQRLRAYSGRGSPSGFVLHMIENLTIDFVRTIIPRRRLPAAVERLSESDQTIFRLIYWDSFDTDPARLARRLAKPNETPATTAEVSEVIERIQQALPRGYYVEPRGESQTTSLSVVEEVVVASGAEGFAVRNPEENVIEGEAGSLLEQAVGVLEQTLPKLAADERLYLQLALSGRPAREIARIVGCKVEEIHKLAQKVKRRLQEELSDDDVVKKWRLSV